MAFGDAGGYVHVWTDRAEFKVNMYSRPTEVPNLRPPLPPIKIDADTYVDFALLVAVNVVAVEIREFHF